MAGYMTAQILVESYEETVPDKGVRLHIYNLRDLADQFPFLCSRFQVDAGAQTSPESHAVSELWFIASGEVTVHVESETRTASAGDAVHFKPWQRHWAVNTASSTALIFSMWWPSRAPD